VVAYTLYVEELHSVHEEGDQVVVFLPCCIANVLLLIILGLYA